MIGRGESTSIASSIRKNASRTVPGMQSLAKWKRGRKGDLILRTTSDLEFGGAEAGKFFKSEKATKWLLEGGIKLPKMLKDMFVRLGADVGWSKTALRELRTIGFVHGG